MCIAYGFNFKCDPLLQKNKVSISKTCDINRSNKLGTFSNETEFSLKGLCAIDK